MTRDLFGKARTADDPISKTRAHVRRELPKRFYTDVSVTESDGLLAATLDGRGIRTPAGRTLAVPARQIAEAIAGEWRDQGDHIDPATMPVTRLVNAALDGVAGDMAGVRAEIVNYAGSDLLIYRADDPEGLVARQAESWDPVIEWADGRLGGRFVLAEGVMHVAQDAALLGRVDAVLADVAALPLAAIHVVTTLTGSALLALALWDGRLIADDAWNAAHVDEDWNMELWGRDTEALDRRAARRTEFQAAITVIDATRPTKSDP